MSTTDENANITENFSVSIFFKHYKIGFLFLYCDYKPLSTHFFFLPLSNFLFYFYFIRTIWFDFCLKFDIISLLFANLFYILWSLLDSSGNSSSINIKSSKTTHDDVSSAEKCLSFSDSHVVKLFIKKKSEKIKWNEKKLQNRKWKSWSSRGNRWNVNKLFFFSLFCKATYESFTFLFFVISRSLFFYIYFSFLTKKR